MRHTPEFLARCSAAGEADRALGAGFAIETTPEVAADCGVFEPGDPDQRGEVEDALGLYLHPPSRAREANSGRAVCVASLPARGECTE